MHLKLFFLVTTLGVNLCRSLPTISVEPQLNISHSDVEIQEHIRILQPRGQANLLCCSDMADAHGWKATSEQELAEAIIFLQQYYVETFYILFPHKCNCYHYSKSSVVETCNDNEYFIEVLADLVTHYVGSIKDGCGRVGKGYCGQQFDDTKFNVIARDKGDDRCP